MKKMIEPKLDCEPHPSWGSGDGVHVERERTIKTLSLNRATTLLAQLNFSALKIPLTLSLANQVISSGGNFLLSIYLARTLSLAEFGVYGIGYGLCMLYVGIGNSVILTQMSVNMSSQAIDQREIYAAKMLNAVFVLGGMLLSLTAIGFMIASFIWPESKQLLVKVCAISLAAALFLCNEFFISYAYVKRKESLALVVNGVTMLVLFICLFIEYKAGIAPSVESALFFYAFGAAAGAATAYHQSPIRVSQGVHGFAPTVVESWSHGRWALGGVIITWIQSQTYAYIVIFMLGSAGVGLVNAAKLFISPFSFLLSAVQKITIPRLADLRQSNPSRMRLVSVLLTSGLTVLTIIYSLMILSSVNFVTTLVLGRHDANIEILIGLWCCVLIFQMVRTGGGVLLQVQKKFRILTLLNIPSAILTTGLAFFLTASNGTTGAVWSVVIGEIALALLIWREIAYDKTHQH